MLKKIVFCVLVIAVCAASYYFLKSDDKQTTKVDTLERIMQSKTIRCGYLPYEPYIIKDVQTGELSGLIVDYLNTVAAENNFAIDWVSEIVISDIIPTLDGKKVDVACIPATSVDGWEKVADFVGTVAKIPYYVYVKQGDTQPIKPTDRFAAVDGYVPQVLTPKHYPEADMLSLSQNTSTAELFDQLKYKKVKAIIMDGLAADLYMKNNPGVIQLYQQDPIATFQMYYIVRDGEVELGRFLEKTFGTQNNKENQKQFQKLMQHYGIKNSSLILN